jgi:hypothetical protein
MSTGIAVGYANAILDWLCRGVAPTAPADYWVKLHIGDPGAAGTANPSVNTTRKQVAFATPAAGGSIASTTAATWTASPAPEDHTYFSVWTASTAGSFIMSGTVTANPVGAGDAFTAAAGALQVPMAVAA